MCFLELLGRLRFRVAGLDATLSSISQQLLKNVLNRFVCLFLIVRTEQGNPLSEGRNSRWL